MYKSINAWSVPASESFEAMFRSVAKAGFAAIELNIDEIGSSKHSLSMQDGQAVYDHVRDLSRQFNLPVCSISTSLYGSCSLGSRNPDECRKGQNLLRKQLECARELGADGILVVPGGISPAVSPTEAFAISAATIRALIPEIMVAGIKVGLENVWNGFFLTARDMCDFIDQFKCPLIGAYFDVGNVAVFSYSEHWIDALGSRIFKIHVKDYHRSSWFSGHFANLLEGSIDWPAVAIALSRVGYTGSLTAELDQIPACPDLLYHMTSEALDYIIAQSQPGH